MNNIEIIKSNNDLSGKMYNEKFVKNNYFDIYNEIINFCKNELFDLPFKEKVYHYVNNITEKIYCCNPNCNNLTKFKNSNVGYYKYCSNSCISKDPKIKKVKEDKSYEKYGTKSPSMNKNIKEKIIKTNQKKYGSNSPLQNPLIQIKSKNTLLKNYGVDNPNKSDELKIKRIESFKKSSFKKSYLKTTTNKYGVEYPYQIPEILKKCKDTLYKNYSVYHPYKNIDLVNKSKEKRKYTWIKNKLLNDNIIEIDYNKREYIMKCDAGKDHTFKIGFDLYKS